VPIKLARRRLLSSTISVLSVVCLLTCADSNSLAQNAAASSDLPQDDVVLTKLSPPIYPILAKTAGVAGDVVLKVTVRQDGAVEAEVISGPAMLQQPALESVIHSQFECKNCSGPISSFQVVYTFQLNTEGCEASAAKEATNAPQYPQATKSKNHVTVIELMPMICDPAGKIRKPRSAKCLWLWRCGSN